MQYHRKSMAHLHALYAGSVRWSSVADLCAALAKFDLCLVKGNLISCSHSKYSNQYLHLRKVAIVFPFQFVDFSGFIDSLSE